MRRLLTFSHDGVTLAASLDEAGGATGLLIVTGGTELRAGAHGGLARLGADVAAAGFPVFRFDRRGVGDSEGDDPGYAGSGGDIAAAAVAFRAVWPRVDRLVALGHCDGATALALSLLDGAFNPDGLILANPWVVEAPPNMPPAAAIRRRYADQLHSWDGWRRLLSGSVNYRALLRGLARILRPGPTDLARRVGSALAHTQAPIDVILADRDATAIAFADAMRRRDWAPLGKRMTVTRIASGSHSFAGPDHAALVAAVVAALSRQSG